MSVSEPFSGSFGYKRLTEFQQRGFLLVSIVILSAPFERFDKLFCSLSERCLQIRTGQSGGDEVAHRISLSSRRDFVVVAAVAAAVDINTAILQLRWTGSPPIVQG